MEKIIKLRNLINELYNDCGNTNCDNCKFMGFSNGEEMCNLTELDEILQRVEVD